MKNSAFALALLLSMGLALTSCKKDEDTEPTFRQQVTGHWVSQSVERNGVDATSGFSSDVQLNADESFAIELNYIEPFTGQSLKTDYNGSWETTDNGPKLTLNYNNAPTQIWTISGLSDNSMTAEYTDSQGQRYEIVFTKR
jgi:hypothetical protein